VPSAPAGPSATEIEALIERKVAEILAQRERDTAPTSFAPAPAPPSPAHVVAPKISAEVQRRLAALEQKVAEGERAQDERAAGLRYLLEAKQAKERGDDGEALRCYESAREYFPGQEKLGRKIEGLRRRLEEREGGREAGTGTRREKAVVREEEDARDSGFADEDPAEEDEVVQVQVPTRRPRHEEEEEEDNFHPSEADDDDSFVHYHHKQHRRAPAPKPAAAPALSPDAEALILSIINSRDVSKIRELQGVGPKKARDLVEWLELMGEGEEANGGRIERLEQVMALGGWGRGTVERIVAGVAC
jgi:DNA uptake protein ComE-like DNA-binding protein